MDQVSKLKEQIEVTKSILNKKKDQINYINNITLIEQKKKIYNLNIYKLKQEEKWTSIHNDVKQKNYKYNDLVKNIIKLTDKLISIDDSSNSNNNNNNNDNNEFIFSQNNNLQNYHNSEKLYSNAFNKYISKQFQPGITQHLTSSKLNDSSKLSIENVLNSIVENNTNEYNDFADEVQRLQTADILSWQKYIESKMALSSSMSMKIKIVEISNQNSYYSQMTDNQIRQKTEELSNEKINYESRIEKMLSQDIPQMIEEIVPLFLHSILKADYKLKILRQQYFVDKLDNSINLMLAQHGRMRLLLHALNKEYETIFSRIAYLKLIRNGWQDNHELLSKRINNYQQFIRKAEFSSFMSPLSEFASKDSYLFAIKTAIQFVKECGNIIQNKEDSDNLLFEENEDYEEKIDLNNKFDIVTELDVLNITKMNLETKRASLGELIINKFKALKLQIENNKKKINSNSHIHPLKLMLLPPGYESTVLQLESSIQNQTRQLKQVSEVFKSSRKEIDELCFESQYDRKLWIDFITDPATMIQQIQNLGEKVTRSV